MWILCVPFMVMAAAGSESLSCSFSAELFYRRAKLELLVAILRHSDRNFFVTFFGFANPYAPFVQISFGTCCVLREVPCTFFSLGPISALAWSCWPAQTGRTTPRHSPMVRLSGPLPT